jgi:1,2-diacylglycerol 3-alpha-glucosyltransferase
VEQTEIFHPLLQVVFPSERHLVELKALSRMTIAVISEDFDPARAGVGVHLQNLIPVLIGRGHEVVVITSRRPGESPRSNQRGVTVYRNASIRISGFSHSVTTTRVIRRTLAQHRVDVVHIHFLSRMALQARAASAQLGIPAVYTYHMAEEILTSPFGWCPPVQRRLTRAIIDFCNRFELVTFPSAALKDAVRRKGLHAPSQLLGNAIAFATEPQATPVPASDRFVLLFVGRLSPEKNLALLIRAFATFTAQFPFAELWLAGAGPQRQALEKLTTSAGVARQVTFLGHMGSADLAERYRAADAFVLPSLFETQGMVCIEAMQFGKPLVVSDGIVSCRELVDEGGNGLLFDHRNENDLVRALSELARDPDRRAAMAARSLAKAAAFSLPDVVKAHEEMYRRVIDQRRK